MSASRALGLLLGYAADRVFADPSRFHPVAGFGSVALRLESRWYADSRAAGVRHVTLLVVPCSLPFLVERRLGFVGRVVLTAGTTWAVLGGTSLSREAGRVADLLPDLPAARTQVGRLVGRSTANLSSGEVARAAIESVAENTSDAVVAPLVWGALAGPAGLAAYRAANTLDAMVGHKSPRYLNFGWAAARLDDLLNLPGSRLAALLAVVLGPSPVGALRAWRRDAGGHPSPNAGPVEAAFAGALGVRLGGANTYGDQVESRVVLGSGRPPTGADIAPALELARRVQLGSVLVAAAAAFARRTAG